MILNRSKTLIIASPTETLHGREKNMTLDVLQRKHIKDVLKRTTWKVSGKGGAAEILGLKPTTLESRMKKLGISRPKKT